MRNEFVNPQIYSWNQKYQRRFEIVSWSLSVKSPKKCEEPYSLEVCPEITIWFLQHGNIKISFHCDICMLNTKTSWLVYIITIFFLTMKFYFSEMCVKCLLICWWNMLLCYGIFLVFHPKESLVLNCTFTHRNLKEKICGFITFNWYLTEYFISYLSYKERLDLLMAKTTFSWISKKWR